jgi:hypothetical protein
MAQYSATLVSSDNAVNDLPRQEFHYQSRHKHPSNSRESRNVDVEDFRATALFALAVKGQFAITDFFLVHWGTSCTILVYKCCHECDIKLSHQKVQAQSRFGGEKRGNA